MAEARGLESAHDTIVRADVHKIPSDSAAHPGHIQRNSESFRRNESLSSSLDTLFPPTPSLVDDKDSRSVSPIEEELKISKFIRRKLRDRFERTEEEFEGQLSRLLEIEQSEMKWSGTGKILDVDYDDIEPRELRRELKNSSKELGSGGFGVVSRVTCRSIPLARKSLPALSKGQLDRIKSEIAMGANLKGHGHFIKLVGTYRTEDHAKTISYHILTFPVADCDLDKFLRNCVAARKGDFFVSNPDIQEMLIAASAVDIPGHETFESGVFAALRNFLKRTMGCMADAVMWMHSVHVRIAHLDLKPANVLLRNGRLYLTDFGLAKYRSQEANTYTEQHPGLSRGYAAPEVEDAEEYSPFRADIYSLGCIFLHLVSVMYGSTTVDGCCEILKSARYEREIVIQQHIEHLAPRHTFVFEKASQYHDSMPPHELLKLIKRMLKNNHMRRPKIAEVNQKLRTMGGLESEFHAECCASLDDTPAEWDEWTLIQTEDGREVVGGMQLRTDRFQADRPAWDPNSFRTTSTRPIGPGEISTGFGLGEARGDFGPNQLKPVRLGWNMYKAQAKREREKAEEALKATQEVGSPAPDTNAQEGASTILESADDEIMESSAPQPARGCDRANISNEDRPIHDQGGVVESIEKNSSDESSQASNVTSLFSLRPIKRVTL